MEQIKITPTKIDKKQGANGEYLFVTAGEDRYSCFSDHQDIWDSFIEGQEVSIWFTFSKDGKYKNIVGVGGTQPEPKKKFFKGDVKIAEEMRTESIRRSQEIKQDSMQIMGSVRDSVLIVIAKMRQSQSTWSDEEIKREIKYWKKEITEMYY